jgi:hypothetical protein
MYWSLLNLIRPPLFNGWLKCWGPNFLSPAIETNISRQKLTEHAAGDDDGAGRAR